MGQADAVGPTLIEGSFFPIGNCIGLTTVYLPMIVSVVQLAMQRTMFK